MKPAKPIYLDHAATTPTDPQVVEAMLPYFSEQYGNPSSAHRFGRQAENAIESAREKLAQLLNCGRSEIIFTGCGTESDNMALRGVAMQALAEGKRAHIFTAHTEHHAVSHTAEQLARLNLAEVTWLQPEPDGSITPQRLQAALSALRPEQVGLVSVMYANNEIGTIQPIAALAEVAHAYGALFHTDAVQAAGQLSLDVQALGVDMLALSAHKFYGPKGVGLLYLRRGIRLYSAQTGGAQENNQRAGTHNVPLIVGMARALELAYADLPARVAHYTRLRDRLIDGVLGRIEGAYLTGAEKARRLPNHASFAFTGVEANALLMHLDLSGIAASSGSACNTGNPKPSDVLLAIGLAPDLALSSLRLTVGKQNTDADIAYVLMTLPTAIERLRAVRQAQGLL
ncbi:MAG: cysteine desulfurase NifS [Candidatus Thermofonsia Clade 1 bacterium]|jgi:cysteine desulfurase|uniref:cysteine desulfurase n=1 Tax=Candidatus Thermofonsia Clade 1 bacterium TaxID=2364210 RepID=A0A2M8PXY5_9CHLR|nr:MAG: cysteine desulfurase NifS [Candidatus Thermofonsia Clade 1 bacterium]PJF42392.1 MAG: cysteine desulfurase NifS [Candidatus Thermofonsia Clade 1 bacterium]RMF51554.1 MAG: cysteine desulfurase [Chloroflexota bacterium]